MSKSTKLNKIIWITCISGILMQASFLFTGGTMLQTLLSVTLLASASFFWIWRSIGLREALITVLGVMTIGYVAEVVGVATGYPFGEYAYSGGLGPSLLGVSLIVPVAWLMLAYPAWHVSQVLVSGTSKIWQAGRIAVGAWALTAWDVFLDPQMVAAGNWGWANPEPSLIGVPGIPLTNYAGWLLVGVVMMSFLEFRYRRQSRKIPTKRPTASKVAVVIYLWTFVGSIIANLTFWDRPTVAFVGGLLMATVAVPLCIRLYVLRQKDMR